LTQITYVAAIVNIMAPQFIRVLQMELSFDNNIPTQYFRFNHK
jgi:hypothetical protein